MTERGTRALFAGGLRLVPFSGIQYCDVVVPRALCSLLKARFIEEMFESDGTPHRILLPLDDRLGAVRPDDGPAADEMDDARAAPPHFQHPVTGKAVDPARILEIDGEQSVARFAGHWIPLPFLRFMGRDEQQRPRYDAGPSNWVRAYIEAGSGTPRSEIQITLAFDTNLERQSPTDAATYVAPSCDDAAFGSTFICAESVDDVSALLGQPWLEAWLRATAAPHAPDDGGRPVDGAKVEDFRHVQMAHYLTLLRLLAATKVMPEARFADTIERRLPIRNTFVDLVLDIGDTETTALLVDIASAGAEESPMPGGFAEHVVLRDLTVPNVVHEGPLPTAREFTSQPFGDASASRDSGRPDAFAWPSLVLRERSLALS